ncbi:hypothetical protein GW915_05915 [bacterium]|nr:hypothetical protein [bacterium]
MQDIDFENFSVEQEKAEEIRRSIEIIKEQDLVADLKILCSELGYDVEVPGEQESLPGMGKGPKDLCLEICSIENNREYLFELAGNELRFSIAGQLVCDVSFLPKNNEFLVGFVHTELWKAFEEEHSAFENIVAMAKKRKGERQKLWKARFNKKKN